MAQFTALPAQSAATVRLPSGVTISRLLSSLKSILQRFGPALIRTFAQLACGRVFMAARVTKSKRQYPATRPESRQVLVMISESQFPGQSKTIRSRLDAKLDSQLNEEKYVD